MAVCHEWTVAWGGSEQVASRAAIALDATDVFTFAARPELAERVFSDRRLHVSWIGRAPLSQRYWPWLLPFTARWWRRLDLRNFDAVVTCSHATVNSIRVRPGAPHISYCCTPMRYAWLWRSELQRVPYLMRPLWPVAAWILRRGDRRRARRVHLFLAVSCHVAERIERFYARPSIVIYPPVDTEFFTPDPNIVKGDYFLLAGRLVAYKKPWVAVQAAQLAGVRLIVAGSGPGLRRLRAAAPDVEFREQPSGEELRDLYRGARALVFPGLEDFGIVLVEAQACGTPVIAFRAGGAVEAVRDGETGVLYESDSVEDLARVLSDFDSDQYDVKLIRRNAEQFGVDRFDQQLMAIVHHLTKP